MASAPISIKLRCASWQQLASIYKRDLSRNAIFLKTTSPPALGTPVRIDLTLPSESMVVLSGTIFRHIADGELEGRGPGIDVKLNAIPQSAMWLIETALASAQKEAGRPVTPPAGTPTGRAATSPGVGGGGGGSGLVGVGAPAPRRPPAPPSEPRDAALGDGSELAAAESELVIALSSELESIKRLNPFQVLGLPYHAGDAEVRQAFGDLTKRYHPDRYARFHSQDIRRSAAEIFICIRDAYRKLGDATARAAVLSQLQGGASPRAATPAPAAPAARPSAPAIRVPTPPPVAASAAPPTPPGPAAAPAAPAPVGAAADGTLGELALDGGKFEEALAFYRAMLRKNPTDRQARVGVELAEGMRALAARDRMEAAQRFEAALEIDPANERAARELAEMRRLATNERKGMLSRLLGKKE